MNLQQLTKDPPAGVLAISLFGSAARGDSDKGSDTDIFLLAADVSFDQLIDLRGWCANTLGVPPESVSVYPWQVALAMAASGALLVWHLKLEGRVLFQRRDAIDDLLSRLSPFTAYSAELETFTELVEDIAQAWADGRGPTELDLHVLQLVVRNVCILVTVFFGQPAFGRTSAVEQAKRLSPALPVNPDMYRELCAWHLLFLRGYLTDVAGLRKDHNCEYLAMTRSVIAFVKLLTC